MSVFDSPYIPGKPPARDGPLARFLPPHEDGIAAGWLAMNAPPGSWVLDPFGVAPRLAAEASRAGYRVLVTANNPIARFLLEMTAAPPTTADLKAALADLAISKKGEERLETHLQSLYLTKCTNCGRDIPASAFLWKKGDPAPYARIYTCPACSDSGQRPATEGDAAAALQHAEMSKLHRARLLDRVALPGDPDRASVEEALAVYQPRAIYALATLINRLDSPGVTPERRRVLSALFLSACDAANNLWRVDNDRPRPKQLTVSDEFRENNVWMALENAVDEWSAGSDFSPVVQWPARIPESGGVILYEGRIADLANTITENPVAAVVTVLPRPNQAYWTLCALWAGWLWGAEAAEPFHLVLRRRRYDWVWHLEALQAAFRSLFDLLKLGTPCLTLVPEPEAGFLTAALAAGDANSYQLKSIAMRSGQDPIQVAWTRGEKLRRKLEEGNLDSLREAIRDHLNQRGEPTFYLPLYAAALAELKSEHALIDPELPVDEVIRSAGNLIQDALTGDGNLVRFGGGEGVDTGLWWLAAEAEAAEPLCDRVEVAVVKYLIDHPGCSLEDILVSLSAAFPGLLTPSLGLTRAILNSYAVEEPAGWKLNREDWPAARKAELNQMADRLRSIGERLDYGTTRADDRTLVWEAGGTSEYVFFLKASAILDRELLDSKYPRERCLVVIPEPRVSLLEYKVRRDPALAARQAGLGMMRFQLVRAMADQPMLDRTAFETQIKGITDQEKRGQLRLL